MSEALLTYADVCTTQYVYDRYHHFLNADDWQPSDVIGKWLRKINSMEKAPEEITNDFLDNTLTHILDRRQWPTDLTETKKEKETKLLTVRDLVIRDCAEILVSHLEGMSVKQEGYLQSLKSNVDLSRFYLNLLRKEPHKK